MEQLALLRAVTQRLVTTATEDLPRVASFIASSLSNCSAALNGEAVKPSDVSVPLHKLRTRLSSLLQDRTSAGRSTAAIIIKSLAEASRPTESAIWESWARGLIGCLNKPDPWEVRRLYVLAIVRIFMLARDSQTLQREVTTPLLPSFITVCLSAIKPVTAKQSKKSTVITSPLLPTVLRCWDELIQDHSATFRPFVNRIKPICLSVVSDFSSAVQLRQIAVKVLASLHCCAPKASAASDWQLSISNYLKATHDTLDLVLRGVREDWTSIDESQARQSVRHDYSKEPKTTQTDAAGLDTWKGIHQGVVRARSLLECIGEMVRCQSVSIVVPLGLLLDLTARITGVTVPKQSNNARYQLRQNPEVAKEEREALWVELPALHVESMKLFSEMIETAGQAISTLMVPISEQLFDIFLAEGWNEEVRRQCYICLSKILKTNCCQSLQLDRQGIEAMCKSCCLDLSSLLPESLKRSAGGDLARDAHNDSSILRSVSQATERISTTGRAESDLVGHARTLLPLLFQKLPSNSISHAIRTELDRISILINEERAMFASIMNPPGKKIGQRALPSILPFFANGVGDDDIELEAFLRPRMPVIPETFAPAFEGSSEAELDHGNNLTGNVTGRRQDQASTAVEQLGPSRIEAGAATGMEPPLKDPQPLEPSPSPESTLGKRDLKAMAEAAEEGGEKAEDPRAATNFKKPRVEDMSGIEHGVQVWEKHEHGANGTSGAAIGLVEGNAVDSGAAVPTQVLSEQPLMYGRTNAVTAQEDSDSDSDIPAINPELATDDEFDDDEEDEEK